MDKIKKNLIAKKKKIGCLHCTKKCSRVNMRNHIVSHMIKGTLQFDRCGYCGKLGCDIFLKLSGSLENGTYHPESHCKYFYKFSYKKKSVKSYPCTNKPVACEQCKGVFWSYSLADHYRKSHFGVVCPEMISVEERTNLLNPKW